MKKYLSFFLVLVFLAFPLSAFATYIGQHTMDVDANFNGQYWNNYVTDYNVKANPFGGTTEVFCVENANMNGNLSSYDFYTIDGVWNMVDDSGIDISTDWYEKLKQATWYANWFIQSTQTDADKMKAQVAVWNTIGFAPDAANGLLGEFNAADDKYDYVSNWLFAVSPANGGVSITIPEVGQNYLVAAPVPEPATMLLFGIGLLSLAGISRKKLS